MKPNEYFELAVIGGGCAGLSLARELSTRQLSGKVVVIEPREHYQDDRSWCFWSRDQHNFSDWVAHTWPSWLFGSDKQIMESRSCEGYSYQYIRSADFYRKSLDILAQFPMIELRLGTAVTEIVQHELGWRLHTTKGTLIAKHVVDTRPPPAALLNQSILFQCFLGVEIKLEQPAFIDVRKLELMTNMRMVNGEFCFTYILPFATDHMLVEVTFFSSSPINRDNLQVELNRTLSARGWDALTILRTEYAQLPMGLPEDQTELRNHLVSAGMRGGALRSSSGYAFQRIQHWAACCAQHYHDYGNFIPHPISGSLLNHMDQLFLKVIKKEPALAPVLFNRLIGQVDTECFIRFMNDRASFLDCLKIIACLPKVPFLKAILAGR